MNRTIRKSISLFLLLSLLFSTSTFISCGKNEGENEDGADGVYKLSIFASENNAENNCIRVSENKLDNASSVGCETKYAITSISGQTLPNNLDSDIGGIKNHKGDNYIAYTFYLSNCGNDNCNVSYGFYIDNMEKELKEAIRVRIYEDGEKTDYANERTDASITGVHKERVFCDEIFKTEKVVMNGSLKDFKPGTVKRFTVVIWIEGDDPECVDRIDLPKFDLSMIFKGEPTE